MVTTDKISCGRIPLLIPKAIIIIENSLIFPHVAPVRKLVLLAYPKNPSKEIMISGFIKSMNRDKLNIITRY